MVGTTYTGSKYEVLLVKTDANGTEQWRKTYSRPDAIQVEALSIQQTVDGYIMAGSIWYSTGDKDYWVLKTYADGNVHWEKTFGGGGYDEGYSIALTNDNGYIVAGMNSSYDPEVDEELYGNRYWLVKLDSDGEPVWTKKLEAQMRPYSIKQTTDGGYIIAGDSYTYFNQQHPDLNYENAFFVLKLGASGDFQWQVSLAFDHGSTAYDVIQTSDGNYVAAGFITTHDDPYYNDRNGFVVKINPTGTILWQTQVDFSLNDEIRSIRQTADGSYMFAGNTDYTWNNRYGISDPSDFWVGQLSAGGQVLWRGALGGPREDQAMAIAPTNDGSFVIAGTTTNSSDHKGFMLIKLEAGCTIQQTNGRYRKKEYLAAYGWDRNGRKSSARSSDEGSSTVVFRDSLNRIMATVSSAGESPMGGDVTTTVWADLEQSPRYVRRHYEIMPDNDAATATGTVTLYFDQADFDAYNAMVSADKKLPINPGDAAGKANFRIVKYSGTSSNDDGLPDSYSGGSTVIDPDDLQIVWNNSLQIWEVTFDVTGFSGFFATDAITSESPLPVTFASIEAFITEGILTVNWTVATETNNAWYLVETSSDGKNFEVASDRILSKAPDGNSALSMKYSFTKSYSLLPGMAALLFLVIGFGRKSRKIAIYVAIAGCSLLGLSCKELMKDIESSHGQKVYVRIVQVDQDGTRNYSRIVEAKP